MAYPGSCPNTVSITDVETDRFGHYCHTAEQPCDYYTTDTAIKEYKGNKQTDPLLSHHSGVYNMEEKVYLLNNQSEYFLLNSISGISHYC